MQKHLHLKKLSQKIEKKAENISWQIIELFKILPKLASKDFRTGAGAVVNGYFKDYRNANTANFEYEINVETEVDEKIPLVPEALGSYMSFVGLWVSALNFLEEEFGQDARTEINNFIKDLGKYYPESAKIFNSAQTSFSRKPHGSVKLKILRLIDSAKNACPSLHVEVAAHTYSRLADVIYLKAAEPQIYEPINQVFFEKAVGIIESTMLVKQHTVMDVAVGLAVLSGLDKSFSRQKAYKIINHLFQMRRHGMSGGTILEVRSKIKSIYEEVVERIEKSRVGVPEAVIVYLKEFDLEKNNKKA